MELFGTDGIRAKANVYPMTAPMALKLGQAVGLILKKRSNNSSKKPKVVLGKDTRLSGYLIESALVAGLVSVGIDVYQVGPMPTPAVAHLTKSFAANAGIMISASHNPYEDNGIKFFNQDGIKFCDETCKEIEDITLNQEIDTSQITHDQIGMAHRIDDARGRYIEFAKNTIDNESLDTFKIVLDCANGAAYHIAKFIFKELGAQVITLNAEPNGININDNCGAMHPQITAKEVIAHKADCGIALDGDADRIILIDETGEILDGDYVTAIVAAHLKQQNKLTPNVVVRTKMVNQGFVAAMSSLGIKTIQTNVGDKFVLKKMRELNAQIGGEQSGHIAFLDHCTTGDGTISGLQILKIMKDTQKPLSELKQVMTKYPQVLLNINVTKKPELTTLSSVQEQITNTKEVLGDDGKILVRYSGTQMKLRIMVQGKDKEQIQTLAQNIASEVQKHIGA